MTPITIEIGGGGYLWLDKVTLDKGERRVKPLGGGEAVIVERDDEDGPFEETYFVAQTDSERPSAYDNLQKVQISSRQKFGAFCIDDTQITARYSSPQDMK